ncbi:hypothetical protein [Paenibacillus apii]|uniref:hypothetical protein n=1 Tax=Paenibacillus apii TaxID=1850370 RepID=UPI001438F9A4|nr:hypothetical protein [Paenibacillus apii]NJJ37868.1 hypothetical protein [Paenibacillus apii]
MKLEDLEEEARFIAQNAQHNLHLVKKQAGAMDPVKLDRNIKWLEMMIELHKCDLAALKAEKKKARLAGRTGLRTRLKYLVASILTLDRQKRKEEAA